MPFVCAFCQGEIVVGDKMVSDDRMDVAHERCAARLAEQSAAHLPSVTLVAPPPSALPLPRVVYPDPCARCGEPTGMPQRSCSRCYLDLCPKCIAAGCCGDRPAHLGEKTYCAQCKKPCRSVCPYCKRYVHGGYGLSGTCGLQHEATCEGARRSREPESKLQVVPTPPCTPPPVICDTAKIYSARKKPRMKRGKTSGKKKERARR